MLHWFRSHYVTDQSCAFLSFLHCYYVIKTVANITASSYATVTHTFHWSKPSSCPRSCSNFAATNQSSDPVSISTGTNHMTVPVPSFPVTNRTVPASSASTTKQKTVLVPAGSRWDCCTLILSRWSVLKIRIWDGGPFEQPLSQNAW